MKNQIPVVMFFKKALLFLFMATFIISCRDSENSIDSKAEEDRFEVLISFIENNYDFVNSPESPAAVNAAEVYRMFDENIHIIDVRTPGEFKEGRVPGAVNIPLAEILDYFENKITPPSFEKIYLFSRDHQESMIANGALRMLGYDNTYNVRWGMSSWNSKYADRDWATFIGSDLVSELTTEPYSKNEPGPYPIVLSKYTDGYDILRERVAALLQKPYTDFLITAQEVMASPDDYYLINYWGQRDYDIAHLKGAIQYAPRRSLKRSTYLNTLPTDKTIVLYCYSNSTTPIVIAYFDILGYNVKTIVHGANSFMHDVLAEKIRSYFSYRVVNDFPIETDEDSFLEHDIKEPIISVPEGGC